MNKELLNKKLSVLLDQDVQKEMELRARMGLKLRPELKFYGICSSSKNEPKNSENLPHYLFVTTDEKKANKAREIISDALQSRNQSEKEHPKFDILFEIQESKLLLLSPEKAESFEAFKNEFQKTNDLLTVEAEKRLSVLNKGILNSAVKKAGAKNKNTELLKKFKDQLINRLYRAQVHGKEVRVKVYDKNAPSQEPVVMQSQQQDRTRER